MHLTGLTWPLPFLALPLFLLLEVFDGTPDGVDDKMIVRIYARSKQMEKRVQVLRRRTRGVLPVILTILFQYINLEAMISER